MESCPEQRQCDKLHAVRTDITTEFRSALAIENRSQLTELGYAPRVPLTVAIQLNEH